MTGMICTPECDIMHGSIYQGFGGTLALNFIKLHGIMSWETTRLTFRHRAS